MIAPWICSPTTSRHSNLERGQLWLAHPLPAAPDGLWWSHAESLYRVLRALASGGVFQEHADRSFSLTPVGDCLRADAAQPVGAWATFIGRQYHCSGWPHLLETVRTGEPAFVHTHGVSGWEYRARTSQEKPSSTGP